MMKSKASYFSISMPLMTENMKRLWAMPALGFLIYFLSGAFPIIMSYGNLNYMASYIEMSLHNLQPFYMMVHLILPVMAAVMLFKYLNSPGSVAVMHSMPFTRPRLFNSNYLTGLIMTTLPILANGLVLLLLAKPTFRQWGPPDDRTIADIDVFCRPEVLNWIGTSLLIVAVLYSVAVFAAIVTGNSTMHALASYYFIFLIPLLYVVFNVYFQEFLFGFDLSGSWIERALSISPYTGILRGMGYFNLWEVVFYLFTIVAMTLIAFFLYTRRKLERAGDSLTFAFVKPIISYVVAFLGMTMLGFYFKLLGESRLYMYAGFAAGTLIFFIIGTMVVEKSPRIFNRKGLTNFLIYALIAILFIVGLNFDLTGFEKKVPKPENVEWAEFYLPFDRFAYTSKHLELGNLKDPENIRTLTEFHRSVVADKNRLLGEIKGANWENFRILYKGKSHLPMSRQYRIDYETYKNSPHLKAIFESEEYKANRSFFNSSVDEYVEMYVYSDFMTGDWEGRLEKPDIRDKKTIDELMALIEKDFQAMTYEDLLDLKPNLATIEIQFTFGKDANKNWIKGERGYISLEVRPGFVNTIKWLKDHKYIEELTADRVDWVEIYSPMQEKTDADYDSFFTVDRPRFGDRGVMKITEPDKIQKILDNYDGQALNYEKAYEVTIAFDEEQGFTHGYLNNGIDFLQ